MPASAATDSKVRLAIPCLATTASAASSRVARNSVFVRSIRSSSHTVRTVACQAVQTVFCERAANVARENLSSALRGTALKLRISPRLSRLSQRLREVPNTARDSSDSPGLELVAQGNPWDALDVRKVHHGLVELNQN
jgi:hypothetical protein